MGCDAEFRHLVHFAGADLHLDRPMPTDHGGVQRLVAVGLGEADVILEATGDRSEGVVHHGQGAIAALHRGANDAHRGDVVELVERLLLPLHLAPDAIEMLRPSIHLAHAEANGLQSLPQQIGGDRQPLLPLAALGGHRLLDFAIGLRFQDLEGQILQLPLEPSDAQPIGQRGVDLARFAGDALLLLGLQGSEGAHVVQAIRQFHQHHPNVAGHGQKHPPQVFRLGLGVIGEVDAAQLGHPLHQRTHLRAEMLLKLPRCHLGVLHHIVQETSGDHGRTGPDVAQQIRHRDRMDDVGLAGGPKLALVKLEGEIKGGGQQGLGVGGAAVAGTGRHVPDALLQPFRQRHAIVGGFMNQPAPLPQPAGGRWRLLDLPAGPIGTRNVCSDLVGDGLEHRPPRG
ncbi:MAG: hypothetical protein VKO44_05105 [Cyanobacteriota bacterium]|nr:hypothetical protein [Cyanobacteriota bacterium]